MKNALKLPITCVELCNCGKDFRDRIFFSDGVNQQQVFGSMFRLFVDGTIYQFLPNNYLR